MNNMNERKTEKKSLPWIKTERNEKRNNTDQKQRLQETILCKDIHRIDVLLFCSGDAILKPVINNCRSFMACFNIRKINLLANKLTTERTYLLPHQT